VSGTTSESVRVLRFEVSVGPVFAVRETVFCLVSREGRGGGFVVEDRDGLVKVGIGTKECVTRISF
jgi:hypothetical protein